MTPEQYQSIRDVYLEIRECNAKLREAKLVKLQTQTPELANLVRQLLDSETDDPSFLAKPLIQRDEKLELETKEQRQTVEEKIESPRYIGHYRILQKIGEGGHGVVYMAEQSKPIRRKVAIKWIKPGMDSKMILARFEAERQALAMMSHPSIANVLDADTTESGHPFFVMELVHGVPLDRFCNDNELSLTERLKLFQQVCSAVHHAHRKGIIHRDIKPCNVLVTVESGKPLAKVIDFGIAKALHMPLTEKTMYTEYGQIIGTLEYMSPEQALMSQSGIDVRSDVYSLGVLLYLLITGEAPLSKNELLKEGIWELKNVLQHTRPQTPSLRITSNDNPQRWRDHSQSPKTWLGYVKGDLDWVTMKALAKEPDKRYDSAADLAQDIENYLRGDSVFARPPTTWYKLTKFVRRNRVAALVTATLITAMILSICALAWGYYQSQKSLIVVSDANKLVNEKAVALEKEKRRADANAQRMAKMLERSILESAWTSAMRGNLEATNTTLTDIAESDRSFAWQFVESVGKEMKLPTLRSENSGAVRKIALHSESGYIVTITNESVLEVWSSVEMTQVATIQLPSRIYSAIAFSRSGEFVLVGATDDSILMVDIVKEKVTKTTAMGKGGIRAIVHAPGKRCWFVTTGANYVCALDDQTLKVGAIQKLPERIAGISLTSSGKHVLVTSLDGTLFLMPTDRLGEIKTIEGIEGEVASFRWDDNLLTVCDWSGGLYELTAETVDGTGVLSAPTKTSQLPAKPSAIDIAQDGQVFGAWRNGQVSWYDPNQQRMFPLRKFSSAIRHVKYLENSGQLLVSFQNGRASLIGQNEIQRSMASPEMVNGLRGGLALVNESISLTGHADGFLKRWDAKTGELIQKSKAHAGDIYALDVNETAGLIASVGADRQIVISQLSNLKQQQKLKCSWGVRCTAFSTKGNLLAAAADPENQTNLREGTVDVWNVLTGKTQLRLAGHTNWVTHIRFIDEDQRIVTLSVDGTAKVWSVASGKCLQTVDLSIAPIAHCMAIFKSSELLIGHDDGSISVWELESGEQKMMQQISGDSIIGLCVPANSSCVMATARSNSELILLDTKTLSVIARLDTGVGNVVGIRTDSDSRQLQIIGESGLGRVWELPN